MIIYFCRAGDRAYLCIPELSRILVRDVNAYRGITAAPYIVFKCANANVVRNISGPLLTGAAAAMA